MSLKLGTTDIAGIATNTKYNAHNLLDFKWSDHLIDDMSWLRADTFSWQNGDTYTEAYNHLVTDIQGKTLQSETISGVTIQYYLADDNHKICPANQEANVLSLYNATGVAWYYILDTDNTRFKLPRSKKNKYQSTAPVIGNGITLGLTDGTNLCGLEHWAWTVVRLSAFTEDYGKPVGSASSSTSTPLKDTYTVGVTTDPTKSGIQTNLETDTDQYKYLYFYVGEYSQTAIEQTAGITSEQLNGKVDLNASNLNAQGKSYVSGLGMPSNRYTDLTLGASGSTYIAPANGYIVLNKRAGSDSDSNYYYIKMSNINTNITDLRRANWSYTLSCTVQCLKNEIIQIDYDAYGIQEIFRFIYAEGEQ